MISALGKGESKSGRTPPLPEIIAWFMKSISGLSHTYVHPNYAGHGSLRAQKFLAQQGLCLQLGIAWGAYLIKSKRTLKPFDSCLVQ